MAESTAHGEKVAALHKGAAKVEKSAEEVKQGAQQLEKAVDHRNELAADRTVYAAERTYAAWVRTGLAAMASGIGAKKLLEGVIPEWAILGVGSVLILFATFSFAVGIWREVMPGPPPPRGFIRRVHPAFIVFFNFCLLLVSLAALVSLWFGRTGGD
jgi:putative membrane protein